MSGIYIFCQDVQKIWEPESELSWNVEKGDFYMKK